MTITKAKRTKKEKLAAVAEANRKSRLKKKHEQQPIIIAVKHGEIYIEKRRPGRSVMHKNSDSRRAAQRVSDNK